MNWSSWQAFVEMGGHGRFVWGSFGGVALGLLIEWVSLHRQAAQRRIDLRQRWLDEGRDGVGGHHHFDAVFHEGGQP